MNTYPQRLKTTDQRFWEKVNITTTDKCWEFNGAKNRDGYGWFRIGKKRYSHQSAWIIARGVIPDGMLVCHTCDNPSCCNPDHLFLGTCKSNMEDKTRKGRNNPPVGERAGSSKLTKDQVLKIRELHASGVIQRKIADMFGVGYKAINKIVLRQRWTHV